MLTMAPPPAWRRWGMAARLKRYMARTFTSCARSQWSREMVSTVPPTTIVPTPALFRSTSRRPKARTAAVTRAAQSSGRARSTAFDVTSPPAARTSAAAFSSSGPRTSASATRAPAAAKSSALARPMPVAAPVIRATRPARTCVSVVVIARSPFSVSVSLPDHRPRSEEHLGGDGDAERPRGAEIHDRVVLHRLLHRQLARPGPLEDAVGEHGGAPPDVGEVDAEAQETARLGELPEA